MLRISLLFSLIITTFAGYAQETIEVTDKYAPDVTEKYHVLKSNPNIKQGLYQAFYNKSIIIASGGYTQGKKSGTWHFFDSKGYVVQHYNYDKKDFAYIAKEDTPANYIKYEFLPAPADTDHLTLPVRIGGLTYGYLPYTKMFKVDIPPQFGNGTVYGILQMLVTQSGRLAECKLMVKPEIIINGQPSETIIDTYNLNTELLSDDDKQFLPASVNHKNVPVTIYVYCKIKHNGRISIY